MEKQRVPYKRFFLLEKSIVLIFGTYQRKSSVPKKDPFDFKLRILFRHGSLNSKMGPLHCCFIYLFLLRLAK